MSTDLAAWLLDRIAEEEAAARARDLSKPIHYVGCYYYENTLDANLHCDCDEDGEATARVLVECEARRRVVELHTDVEGTAHPCPERGVFDDEWVVYEAGQRVVKTYPCPTLRLLAVPYTGHPEFRSEWGAE